MQVSLTNDTRFIAPIYEKAKSESGLIGLTKKALGSIKRGRSQSHIDSPLVGRTRSLSATHEEIPELNSTTTKIHLKPILGRLRSFSQDIETRVTESEKADGTSFVPPLYTKADSEPALFLMKAKTSLETIATKEKPLPSTSTPRKARARGSSLCHKQNLLKNASRSSDSLREKEMAEPSLIKAISVDNLGWKESDIELAAVEDSSLKEKERSKKSKAKVNAFYNHILSKSGDLEDSKTLE